MIIKKLDIVNHIEQLQSLFCREKDIKLDGDINIHHTIIRELEEFNLKTPPALSVLNGPLNYLQKQGTLKIYEIYEFIKIITYFQYLKKFSFTGKLATWIDKVIIPKELDVIIDAFNDKGEILHGFSEDLDRVNSNLYNNRDAIKQKLYGVINSKGLQPYLVDHQIHLVHG